MNGFAFALHGGAGATKGGDYADALDCAGNLAKTACALLADGAAAVDVVRTVVAELEDSGLFVAGRGSHANDTGGFELDAAIMDGHSRNAGAVAALTGFRNPVHVAARVMQDTPHVLLAGDGARRFAAAAGCTRLSDEKEWYRPVKGSRNRLHGTVGAVARDRAGRLAAATSTGGTLGKMAGRVGDSPLIGAGCYADDRFAVSATGHGEMFIRTVAAYQVGARLSAGATLADAVAATLADVAALGGDGGLIAVTADGCTFAGFNSEGMISAAGSDQADVRTALYEPLALP